MTALNNFLDEFIRRRLEPVTTTALGHVISNVILDRGQGQLAARLLNFFGQALMQIRAAIVDHDQAPVAAVEQAVD